MNAELLTKAYTVERLNAVNIHDVAKLHRAVYGRTRQADFFYKKYDTAFTGVSHVGYIAYDAGRIPIGYYGVIPCFLQIDGRIILAAQSADTMTHPRHRFKGLFAELANLTFQLCRDKGIELLFGFPNQNSLPGFVNKLGWETTETMEVFVINLRFPWQRLINKCSWTRAVYKAYLKKRLERCVLPQNGFANDGFNGVYRDENYLKYKTYHRSYTIKLGSAILWIKISDVLLIGDVLMDPEDFDGMIGRLTIFAGKLGLKQVHFHVTIGTTLHQLFKDRFVSIPSFTVIFKSLSGELPRGKMKFTYADIDTF